MFSLTKQVCIILLSFNESLITEYLFLNDELNMVRHTFDMNPVEIKLSTHN